MSERLVDEVMDYAPASLTWRQFAVLMVLAQSFDDDSRKGSPSYDGDSERSEQMRRRSRCNRSQFYDTLKALVDNKVLEVLQRGQKGRMAIYRIPHLALWHPDALQPSERESSNGAATAQGPSFPDPEGSGATLRVLASRTQDPEAGGAPGAQGPGNRDAEPAPVQNGPVSVLETGTLNPRRAFGEDSSNARRTLDEGPERPQGPGTKDPEPAFSVPETRTRTSVVTSPTTELQLHPAGRALPRTGERGGAPSAGASDTAADADDGRQASPQERALIQRALDAMDAAGLDHLLASLSRVDLAALRRARGRARGDDPAAMARSQLLAALASRPLAAWPQQVLPAALRPDPDHPHPRSA